MAPTNGSTAPEKTYFEQQRDLLIGDVAASLESVLQNLNRLNRNLESVIAVGNEFGQVEGLWSQFENVMAPKETAGAAAGAAGSGGAEREGEGRGGESTTTTAV